MTNRISERERRPDHSGEALRISVEAPTEGSAIGRQRLSARAGDRSSHRVGPHELQRLIGNQAVSTMLRGSGATPGGVLQRLATSGVGNQQASLLASRSDAEIETEMETVGEPAMARATGGTQPTAQRFVEEMLGSWLSHKRWLMDPKKREAEERKAKVAAIKKREAEQKEWEAEERLLHPEKFVKKKTETPKVEARKITARPKVKAKPVPTAGSSTEGITTRPRSNAVIGERPILGGGTEGITTRPRSNAVIGERPILGGGTEAITTRARSNAIVGERPSLGGGTEGITTRPRSNAIVGERPILGGGTEGITTRPRSNAIVGERPILGSGTTPSESTFEARSARRRARYQQARGRWGGVESRSRRGAPSLPDTEAEEFRPVPSRPGPGRRADLGNERRRRLRDQRMVDSERRGSRRGELLSERQARIAAFRRWYERRRTSGQPLGSATEERQRFEVWWARRQRSSVPRGGPGTR